MSLVFSHVGSLKMVYPPHPWSDFEMEDTKMCRIELPTILLKIYLFLSMFFAQLFQKTEITSAGGENPRHPPPNPNFFLTIYLVSQPIPYKNIQKILL